jgi:integrase
VGKRVLEDRFLKAVKSEGPQVEIFDTHCSELSIRVTSAGKKAWNFLFTVPAMEKRARMHLGTYPATSLKEARELAAQMREKVEAGHDPRILPEADMTMADLVELRLKTEVHEYIEPNTGKTRKALDTAKEIERRYRKDIIPKIGDVVVKDFCLPRQGIIYLNKVIDPILDRGSERTAGMAFADIQTLLNFAIRRGEIQFNPLAQADLRGSTGEPGNRSLELSEIKMLWSALPQAMPEPSHVPDILKLLLLTGQREGEVCGMRKEEFDLEKKTWLIPAARSKNDFEHLVPLTPPALAIVREAMKKASGEFLFPNRKGKGFNPNAVALAVRRSRKATPESRHGRLGIAKWKPHDLRRTVTTLMSDKLGISDMDIGHVLNHRSTTKTTVTSVHYNKNQFIKEKRATLEKWATLLMKTVAGASSKPPASPQAPQSVGRRQQAYASVVALQ